MEKTNYLGIVLALMTGFMGFSACDSQRAASGTTKVDRGDNQAIHIGDNSEVSVDWAGTYVGVLPCADCPGIRTVVSLTQEGKYTLMTRYLERGDEVYIDEGTFAWDPTGSRITLSGKDNDNRQFLVGENRLFHLDGDGNRITGEIAEHFILDKMGQEIRDIYWELVEINGKSLAGVKLMREPYLRLHTEDHRAEANGGCNGMGGTYELNEENNRLRFSQLISTKMACENMEIEQQLADVLQRTDSYGLANDTLQLFRARMAPLAKFKAVYIK